MALPLNLGATHVAGRVELPFTPQPGMPFFPDQNGGVYETLLNTLPSMLHCMDGAGRMISGNAAWLETLGYTADEVHGRSFSEFLATQSRSVLITDIYPKYLMSGSVRKTPVTMRRKDGAIVPMLLSMTAYRGDRGRIDRSVCLLEELPEGQPTRSAAHAEGAQHQLAFEHASLGIAVVSPEGNVESANPAFLRLLEVPPAQSVKGSFDALLNDKERASFHESMRRLLDGEINLLQRNLNFITPRGRSFLASCRLVLVRNQAGWPKSLIVEVTETQEKRETERRLQRAQKMEAIGQLTGGLAHDFNNLLTIMTGNLQLIESKSGLDEVSARRLQESLEAARRGSELSKQLLAVARKQELAPKDVEINALVKGMAPLLARSLGEQIELKVTTMTGEPTALIDASLLENAILNLTINARDAMPQGGQIVIETVAVELDHYYARSHAEVTPGPYVMVAVSDSGTGMPPEILEKVFQPFFTTKPEGEGTGLGLSMVYGFIKQSGGHINIYSEVGHGTSVKMYLPRKVAAPLREEPRVAKPSNIVSLEGDALPATGRPKKILVVEDQEAVRAVASSFLEDFGYEIVEAGDGLQALAKLQEDPGIDLMFTDVVMPGGLNGFDLAQAARTLRPELKIVHTTGYPKGAVVHQDEPRLKNGFIIMKPYRRDDLKAMIERALEKEVEAG
ncbi:hybrid sensor histidine kinase/response regulator [Aestuariivirga litoralis]|uniref:hybrid sensor histidine kinase/response regulator n=1 Tax=Aestuariivirga litoralis TaxID=2650924 RepID=UPI0018C72B77|nr:PAS domain-containing sensor histidine kinase [Aestuariivirga litoralis]MBG1231121.1 PAS domain S-box protein [Aestuariivirga litoralis]